LPIFSHPTLLTPVAIRGGDRSSTAHGVIEAIDRKIRCGILMSKSTMATRGKNGGTRPGIRQAENFFESLRFLAVPSRIRGGTWRQG
jgi:hypothetical protein